MLHQDRNHYFYQNKALKFCQPTENWQKGKTSAKPKTAEKQVFAAHQYGKANKGVSKQQETRMDIHDKKTQDGILYRSQCSSKFTQVSINNPHKPHLLLHRYVDGIIFLNRSLSFLSVLLEKDLKIYIFKSVPKKKP